MRLHDKACLPPTDPPSPPLTSTNLCISLVNLIIFISSNRERDHVMHVDYKSACARSESTLTSEKVVLSASESSFYSVKLPASNAKELMKSPETPSQTHSYLRNRREERTLKFFAAML